MRNDVKAVTAALLSALSLLQAAAWLIDYQHWVLFDPLALRASTLWTLPLIAVELIASALAAPIIWRLVRRTESAGYYMACTVLSALAALAIVAILASLTSTPLASGWLLRCKASALAGASWGLGFAVFMRGLRALP